MVNNEDNRKNNYLIGKNLEESIFEILSHPLLQILANYNIINLNIEKKGGRNFNYDFLINDFPIEIKNNANSIYDLPEILQLGCTTIDIDYIKFHYEQVVLKHFPHISYSDYIKDINSLEHKGVFSEIFQNKENIEKDTKIYIEKYLSEKLNKERFLKNILEKLKKQEEKLFILVKNNEYYSDKIEDDFNNISLRTTNSSVIISTNKYDYNCLLRWKNNIGVNYPAYQISIKPRMNEKIVGQKLLKNTDNIIKLSKKEKREQGIYFTPKNIREKILGKIIPFSNNFNELSILEPSAGNGSFIDGILNNHFFDKIPWKIDAIEYNYLLYNFLREKYSNDSEITIINNDYLQESTKKKYNLIIGNPPYFLNKSPSKNKYKEYFTGRTNIFIQFIVHSLLKLKENGILSFIVPETFLNCSYYEKTRLFIKENYEIIDIYKNLDNFLDTNYSTISIIIRKQIPLNDCNNIWFYNNIIIYDKTITELLQKEHVFLCNFPEISVFIGKFVWNQHKDILSDKNSSEKFPVLIYNSYSDKKSYVKIDENIDKFNIFHEDSLIIYRGHGNSKYKFSVKKIIATEFPNGYLLENHLLVITSKKSNLLEEIYQLLLNETTKKFIEIYTTSGSLNLHDLSENIPLFI